MKRLFEMSRMVTLLVGIVVSLGGIFVLIPTDSSW